MDRLEINPPGDPRISDLQQWARNLGLELVLTVEWDGPEFEWGDRVRVKPELTGQKVLEERGVSVDASDWTGTVIDERHHSPIHGDFDACLPAPVAVRWDLNDEVWWAPGSELERVEE